MRKFMVLAALAGVVTILGLGQLQPGQASHVGAPPQYADSVVSYSRTGELYCRGPHGTGGGPTCVDDGFTQLNTLGAQDGNASTGWFNLGTGTGASGTITVEFTDNVLFDGPGDDLRVWEAHSFGVSASSTDSADIYVSADGVTFFLVGGATDDPAANSGTYPNDFDISGTGLSVVRFVRIDNTAPTVEPGADGFDLDAIEALNWYDRFVSGGGQLLETPEGTKRPEWHVISFGGFAAGAGTGNFIGEWQVNFHNVGDDTFDKTSFHTTSITEMNFYDDGGGCIAMNFTAMGVWNGTPGYKMIFRAQDAGEPGNLDNARIQLFYPSTAEVYDTHDGDFTDIQNFCFGTSRTYLDNGNLQMADLTP